MPLEAVMLVLDNSSYAINGDYTPTRFAAQKDAATVLFNVKANSNPENVIGLMTMGGRGPEVLCTPTQDEGKIVAALHEVKLSGDADLTTGIQVAQLALKHRQNKNQRQRVIVFVGSPLSSENPLLTETALVKLGKKMKKNNVAIDIVSFGAEADMSDNDARLRAFVDAVNSGENSHFVTVPGGAGMLLSDQIRQSGMLSEDGPGLGGGQEQATAGGSGQGGEGGEFGVDPNLDPELAMALRMSLEEERARQSATTSTSASTSLPSISETEGANAAAPTSTPSAPVVTSTTTPSQPTETDAHAAASDVTTRPKEVPAAALGATDGDEDMAAAMEDLDADEELQRALALSRGEDVEMGDDEGDDGEEEELSEEDAIARAIALSMAEEGGDAMEEDSKKP